MVRGDDVERDGAAGEHPPLGATAGAGVSERGAIATYAGITAAVVAAGTAPMQTRRGRGKK